MHARMSIMRPALKATFERSYADCTTTQTLRRLATRRKLIKRDEDFPKAVLRRLDKQRPRQRGIRPLAAALRRENELMTGVVAWSGVVANQKAYTDLVFKWFLQAYPESLSRQEIAARLGAQPKRIKSLIIRPLLEEGRIFKWGQKVMPYERYLPNVKAPEFYKVTGESPPVMPDIDESAFLLRNRSPAKRSVKKQEDPPKAATESELSSFQQALLTEAGPEEEEEEEDETTPWIQDPESMVEEGEEEEEVVGDIPESFDEADEERDVEDDTGVLQSSADGMEGDEIKNDEVIPESFAETEEGEEDADRLNLSPEPFTEEGEGEEESTDEVRASSESSFEEGSAEDSDDDDLIEDLELEELSLSEGDDLISQEDRNSDSDSAEDND